MLIPVFGVAGAYAFLGERLTLAQLAGGGLILAGLACISRHHQHIELIGAPADLRSLSHQ